MIKIDTLDPSTPLASQFQEKTGPIVLINTFFVPRQVMAEFLEFWQDDASFMKASPGFISTQLHRGTADSQLVVNIAVWESTAALFRAHSDPKFREKAGKMPDGIVAYPHVYEKIAVENVCVA
jgi:heme-degrading monooxygenase HmoA